MTKNKQGTNNDKGKEGKIKGKRLLSKALQIWDKSLGNVGVRRRAGLGLRAGVSTKQEPQRDKRSWGCVLVAEHTAILYQPALSLKSTALLPNKQERRKRQGWVVESFLCSRRVTGSDTDRHEVLLNETNSSAIHRNRWNREEIKNN